MGNDLDVWVQHFKNEGWELTQSGDDNATFNKVTRGPGWSLLAIPLWFITIPWFIVWFLFNRGQVQHLYIRVNADGEITERRSWRTPSGPSNGRVHDEGVS